LLFLKKPLEFTKKPSRMGRKAKGLIEYQGFSVYPIVPESHKRCHLLLK
jgi:hypothetical protein